MNKILLSICLLLLCGCTPQQRIARLEKNHPELFKRDTVWRIDTTITKEVRKDSVFFYNQKDTVLVRDGKLTIKYYYTRDSVYLQGICAPDTVIKRVPYAVSQPPSVINKTPWTYIVAFGILLLAIIVLLSAMLLKKKD